VIVRDSSPASERTRDLYVKVLDAFVDWAVAERHYSIPENVDRRE